MTKLIYTALMSLDGYIEDRQGGFDWAAPDEEMHGFINDLVRPAGTFIYGRRMYETMMGWETDRGFAAASAAMSHFAGPRPPLRLLTHDLIGDDVIRLTYVPA